jgi:phosphohistidine phosphatase SixA
MNMIFIRHGQGEHILNPPDSLQIVDPWLTEKGIDQSSRLIDRFPITADDIIIASPTRRTIQTALHWDQKRKSQMIIHNAVGPRMFPLLPASRALPCDTPLPKEDIQSQYIHIPIMESNLTSWNIGINAIEESLFEQMANEFIDWCRKQNKQKIYIVSHDGTISSYRKFLGEASITRNEFLGETGSYEVSIL